MSAYVLERDNGQGRVLLQSELPRRVTLKDGSEGIICYLEQDEHVEQVRSMLNVEFQRGTYPQDKQADKQAFLAYFCSHDAFVLLGPTEQVYGAFYIKPNYPGRCAHICNVGVVVHDAHRRNGVARQMAIAFEIFAKKLGYTSALFNLVFEDNKAAQSLWSKRGFTVVGRVPKAKLHPEPVDAIMMHKSFE